ncbi:hypothetical protein [Botryobacter ruber]|uniref:hypothetical protein n=1 Tax=Botryobacter ruber TaxID=2171629 RepID=UPI000F652AF0|nr:hypothetical protein [Botryobacter ruber]
MKNTIYLLIVLIVTFGCSPDKIEPAYDSIELAYSSGGTGAFSLTIDSSNVVRKCEYKIISEIESTECYYGTLSQNSIDSLNYFVNKLKEAKPDTLYDSMCQDCSWYIIKVSEGGTTMKSEVVGDNHKNLIDSLANFIIKRSRSMQNRVDSTYTFKLTSRLVPKLPPRIEK